jgi:hypothetical protein
MLSSRFVLLPAISQPLPLQLMTDRLTLEVENRFEFHSIHEEHWTSALVFTLKQYLFNLPLFLVVNEFSLGTLPFLTTPCLRWSVDSSQTPVRQTVEDQLQPEAALSAN